MTDDMILARIRALSNADLLDIALEAPRNVDGVWRDMPESDRLFEYELRRRLAAWLKEER